MRDFCTSLRFTSIIYSKLNRAILDNSNRVLIKIVKRLKGYTERHYPKAQSDQYKTKVSMIFWFRMIFLL
jgi:hypothetical protein